MTNQNYEDYYNACLDSEYETILQDFIKAYHNDEKGYTVSKKIYDFRNDFSRKMNGLTIKPLTADSHLVDWYYKNLIEDFRKTQDDFLKDQFFIRFLEIVVPELKQTLKRNNFDVLKPEVYNANKKETLKFIAIYYAHKKFNDTFPTSNDINYDEIEDINEILHILRSKNKTVTNKTQKNLKTIDEIKRSVNNFVRVMPMDKVIEHFVVLTIRKSKNGKPFLTEAELLSFIQKAFLGYASIPIQKINYARGEKGFIIKRFYEFFDMAVKQFQEPNKKKKYIDLLVNNFENWQENEINEFFKPNKVKENW